MHGFRGIVRNEQGAKWMNSMQKLMLVAATLMLSATVLAEDSEQAEESLALAVEATVEEGNQLLDLGAFEDGDALSDDELGSHRAKENFEIDQITLNDQETDGEVTDNIAIGNTNGDNLINGDAFSNSSGFLSTVQNTGNNVLIQNSTIINVSVESPSSD